jgi:hypothetical protein
MASRLGGHVAIISPRTASLASLQRRAYVRTECRRLLARVCLSCSRISTAHGLPLGKLIADRGWVCTTGTTGTTAWIDFYSARAEDPSCSSISSPPSALSRVANVNHVFMKKLPSPCPCKCGHGYRYQSHPSRHLVDQGVTEQSGQLPKPLRTPDAMSRCSIPGCYEHGFSSCYPVRGWDDLQLPLLLRYRSSRFFIPSLHTPSPDPFELSWHLSNRAYSASRDS